MRGGHLPKITPKYAALAWGLALVTWLALLRVPAEGWLAYTLSVAFGALVGLAVASPWAGPIVLSAAIAGHLIALRLGWFAFLGELWLIFPLMAGVAATLTGTYVWLRIKAEAASE